MNNWMYGNFKVHVGPPLAARRLCPIGSRTASASRGPTSEADKVAALPNLMAFLCSACVFLWMICSVGAGQCPVPDIEVALSDEDFVDFIWVAPLSIWAGKYEVSNAQYNYFDRAHESKRYYDHVMDLSDQPVVYVSWEDANNYCGWLNRNLRGSIPSGYEFRLPTEKEWEVFASCGDARKYPWGDRWPPPNSFNYRGVEGSSFIYNIFHNQRFLSGHDDGIVVTAPVGESGLNEWGLFGVGGNVWEWCLDWNDKSQTARVLRGAGWNNYEPEIIAITNRSAAKPDRSNAMIGFRVVVAPAKK